MIRLLQCEYKKTRRRYIFLTAFAITVIEIVWAFYGKYNEFSIRNGWMMFLYQLPLVNAIFMPLLCVIVSSRLCDVEHKGNMIKQLSAIEDKRKLYDVKLIYGLMIILFCNLINWGAAVVFGYIKGFYGAVPIKLYLLYLLFTVTATTVIYVLQHTISLLFKNQAITFFTGVIGTFLGVFSMFLPQLPALRKLIIWGYYGVLQFVGMFGWTPETKYQNAYFDVMDIDWIFFVVLIVLGVIIYIVGKTVFAKSDI